MEACRNRVAVVEKASLDIVLEEDMEFGHNHYTLIEDILELQGSSEIDYHKVLVIVLGCRNCLVVHLRCCIELLEDMSFAEVDKLCSLFEMWSQIVQLKV